MERLTDARRSRCIFCEAAADEECAFAAGEFSVPCPDYKRYQRLAAIEDILGDDYDLDRLKVIVNQRMTMREEVAERFRITKDVPVERISELVEADRDGRCVVLPCKVGEKVYDITTGNIVEKTVVSIPFLLSKSANHLSLHAINKRDATTTIEPADVGKTVFLTRESAEAALKGEQDG